jgi:hypothetical protein
VPSAINAGIESPIGEPFAMLSAQRAAVADRHRREPRPAFVELGPQASSARKRIGQRRRGTDFEMRGRLADLPQLGTSPV